MYFFIICEWLTENRIKKSVNRTEKLDNRIFNSIMVRGLDEPKISINQNLQFDYVRNCFTTKNRLTDFWLSETSID